MKHSDFPVPFSYIIIIVKIDISWWTETRHGMQPISHPKIVAIQVQIDEETVLQSNDLSS